MGALREAAKRPRPRSSTCKTCLLLKEIEDPEHAQDLADMLADPDFAATGIATAIQEVLGVKISAGSINRHRNSICLGLDD